MRVCHITTVHNVYDTRIFYKECLSLKNNGFEIYFIAPYDKKESLNGVNIIPLKKYKNRLERIIFSNFLAFVEALKIKAQIYHFHDPEFIPWAYLLKIISKSRVIYDVHEDYYSAILLKYWIPNFLRKLIGKIFDKIEKFFSKKFDAIIIAEEFYNEKFEKINKMVVKILNYPIIYNSNNIMNLNIKRDNFNIIYSGTISEERGIWNILLGFNLLIKKNKKVKLFLVGKFSNQKLLNEVENYIIDNNLNDNVIIIGGNNFVKREIIDNYYYYMDLGLVLLHNNPNYDRTMPTKFFEYMQFGLPVLASDFPLWREFFNKYKCGLTVNPEKPEEVSDKILYLIENQNERKKMGEIGKKLVFEYFNWNKEEKKLISLYKELLK